jgi:hypothetical protein
MIIEDLTSWEEFEPKLNEIKSEYGTYSIAVLQNENRILYRGQTDSEWELLTTLERHEKERYGNQERSIENYLGITLRCAPQIESFTDNKFNLPEIDKIITEINTNSDIFHLNLSTCTYEYWVYLRHHGFPSPFLDWTFSPFIAAFFAFSENNKAEKCSIYAYIETPKGQKSGWGPGPPRINVFGSYARAHKRHFLQQSWYTIALKESQFIPNKPDYCHHKFVSHEEIFKSSKKDQDLIIKITIPRSERIKVMEYLNRFNINHFSLFQSEDSLMQTLAFKEIN